MNYPEKYKGSVLNEAFATELFDLIEETEPDYWIYGHHHYNTPEYLLAKTNMLTINWAMYDTMNMNYLTQKN